MTRKVNAGNVAEEQKDAGPTPGDLKRLLIVYMSALALVLLSVGASVVLTQVQSAQLESHARDINVSGRQRMLSQRIMYLAQDLVHSRRTAMPLGPVKPDYAAADLESAIGLFRTSHEALSTSANLTPGIRALYFQGLDGSSLDAKVWDYVANARRVLADPRDETSFRSLRAIERSGLLKDLDAVVNAFEESSISRLRILRQIEVYSLVFAILIIFFEVCYVFLPGHRLIVRTVRSLMQRNAKLSEARRVLDENHAALRERNLRIATDSERLLAAWEQSEKLREDQVEFTQSLSHDLKSPTNTMLLLLDELSLQYGASLDSDGRDLLALSLKTVNRMGDLIDDVLEYAAAADTSFGSETVQMEDCVAGVLSDMAGEIRSSGARIEFGTLCAVPAYRVQMRILVQNLVANAIKYQAEGVRPEIRISCVPVPEEIAYRLTIEDNGIGIAAENQERIFGLFQRLHVRETYPGTGLGLSTCRRIAENHGGQIRVVSAPGEGSTFEVLLREPVMRPERDKVAAAA